MRNVPVLAVALALVAAGFVLLMFRSAQPSDQRSIALTSLVQRIKNNQISEIRVSDGGGVATARSGQLVSFTTQRGESILNQLVDLGATPDELSSVTYTVAAPTPFWIDALVSAAPLVLFAAFTLFAWRSPPHVRPTARWQRPNLSKQPGQAIAACDRRLGVVR